MTDCEAIEIGASTLSLLEKKGIRVEDVRSALVSAKHYGNIFTHTGTGRHLAYFRPVGSTTYWVEYTCEGNSYRIQSAYSHRMEVLRGTAIAAEVKEVTEWACSQCAAYLEVVSVKLTYLGDAFVADLPACPSCQRVLVDEEKAQKMALAEEMLEDK